VIDVGGSHVKVRVSNRRDVRLFESDPQMTAARMVAGVHKLAGDWKYDVVSIGYPGLVIHGKIVAEPHNLGRGWVGFVAWGSRGRRISSCPGSARNHLGGQISCRWGNRSGGGDRHITWLGRRTARAT